MESTDKNIEQEEVKEENEQSELDMSEDMSIYDENPVTQSDDACTIDVYTSVNKERNLF